jgi:N-acetylneuraminic acid mutarotase
VPQVQAADSNATTVGWSTKAAMSTARGSFGVAAVNGKIYAIGGINDTSNSPLSVNEEYNPANDVWRSKADMPTPRSGFAVAVYNNKIYVFGGTISNGYVGNNEVYDPATNTWQTKASMPTPRADLCASVVNDKIYLTGGKRYSSASPYYIETDINEVYDPATDTWSTAAPLPTAVQGYASTVVDGSIYYLGGQRQPSSASNSAVVNSNQVYDVASNSWSKATPLKDVSSYGAAAVTGGFFAPQRIYYVGGYANNVFNSQTQVYNPSSNSWSYAETMPTSRAYLGVAVINDVLYAIGGFNGTNWLGTTEQYVPVGYGTVPPQIQITSPQNKTYQQVTLDFKVNRGTAWMGYSLDGSANVTVAASTKLLGLTQGRHSIVIYANDSSGNMGVSNTVYFSVDTLGPSITLLSPQNQTYDSTDIQLSFTTDEAARYLAYSLDSQDTVTILGNVTLPALSDGQHRLTVYATDDLGNTSEQTVHFTIALFPTVTVVAVLVIITIALAAGYIFFKTRK